MQAAAEYKVVALNLEGVRYIDAAGLGVFLGMKKAVWDGEQWDDLAVPCICRVFYIEQTMPPMIRKLFRVTGLDLPCGIPIGRPNPLFAER